MILAQISSIYDAILQKSNPKVRHSSASLLGFSYLIFCSCSTTRTVPVETLHHDTLYINKEKYDSIYIDNSHIVGRGGDTVYIKDKLIEYRYRLLRDTIRIVQRDSITYEVRITEVKEVHYTHPWIQYLAWAGGLTILLLIIRLRSKIKLLR